MKPRVKSPWSPADIAKVTGRARWTILRLLECYEGYAYSVELRTQVATALGMPLEEFNRRCAAGEFKGAARSKIDHKMWRRDPDGVMRCRRCGKDQPKWINHILTRQRNHKLHPSMRPMKKAK